MPAKKEIDTDIVFDLLEMGTTKKDIAGEIGMSPQTLSRRMADIRKKQGILLNYRGLQGLHLTELQARVLEAITPEKIAEASLTDLTRAFKVLKDAEINAVGGKEKMEGLLGHLLEMEKEDLQLRKRVEKLESDIPDGEFSEIEEVPVVLDEEGEEMPRL